MTPVYIIGESARLKLDRAEEHIKALEREVGEFFDTQPYSTDTEFESDGTEFVIKARLIQRPPKRLGLLIGDAIHNLRGCLDHLVFELAGRPTDEAIAPHIEFPIFVDRTKYKFGHEKRLCGVPDDAKAIIERLQPYHRRDLPNPPPGLIHPLEVVYQLSNFDKHREVQIAGLAFLHTEVWSSEPMIERTFRYGPFEDGAEIARFKFSTRKVEVKTGFTFSVTVELVDPKGTIDIQETLYGIMDFIRHEVLPPLSEPRFYTDKG